MSNLVGELMWWGLYLSTVSIPFFPIHKPWFQLLLMICARVTCVRNQVLYWSALRDLAPVPSNMTHSPHHYELHFCPMWHQYPLKGPSGYHTLSCSFSLSPGLSFCFCICLSLMSPLRESLLSLSQINLSVRSIACCDFYSDRQGAPAAWTLTLVPLLNPNNLFPWGRDTILNPLDCHKF